MKKRLLFFVGIVGILAVGCEKEPADKVAAAQEALSKARNSDAAALANDEFRAAEATLQRAMVKIDAERKKLPFLRSYKIAATVLEESIEEARRAQEKALAEQKRLQAEEEARKAAEAKKPARRSTRSR